MPTASHAGWDSPTFNLRRDAQALAYLYQRFGVQSVRHPRSNLRYHSRPENGIARYPPNAVGSEPSEIAGLPYSLIC